MRAEETRFVLEAVRAGLPGHLSDRAVEDVAPRIESWGAILASCRAHRLSGVLYEGVRKRGLATTLPVEVAEALRTDYYSNLARTLVLFRHLDEIVALASRLGVPLLLLKGAAFAGRLYGNLALRPMADLDLLVARKDARTMVDAARTLGYQRWETADHATSLRHRESGTYLEIHTSLTACPGYIEIRTEDLLERSLPVDDLGEPARTLSSEDHALHLCLHGSFQHGLAQAAVNACDLFLLARGDAFDTERFVALASSRRIAPLVYVGLSLADRLLPDERLKRALDALRPQTLWLHRRLVARLRAASLLDPARAAGTRSPWVRPLLAPSATDALVLVKESLSLPRGLSPTDRASLSVRRAWDVLRRHAGPGAWSRRLLRKCAWGGRW